MPVRRFTPAELILTQRLHLERPLLAMVLLGAGGFALAEGNVFYLGLIAAGVLINALAVWRRSEVYVPRFVVNIAVLLATGFFLLDFLETPDFFRVVGHYLILIQLCKLFEQKRNRDYVQLMALSLVLVLDAALMTTGLWFALLMLAYAPVTCYVTMVLTLKICLDSQATARLGVESRPADPRRVAWNVSGSFPRWRLWRGAFGAAGVCAAVAAGVFLLMPRSSPGALFPLPRLPRGRDRVTGFPKAFRLTELGRITRDRSVVMHVRLESDGKDLGPTGFRGYLRGRVYQTYHRGEWFARRGSRPWWGVRAPLPRPPPEEPGVVVQHVTMDASLLPMTFAIAPTLRVDLPKGVRFSGLYPEMTVAAKRGDNPLEYTAYSFSQPFSPRQREYLSLLRDAGGEAGAPAGRGPSPPSRAPNRLGPAGPSRRLVDTISPGVAELARQWCADLLAERNKRPGAGPAVRDQLNLTIARRIADKLAANFAYTLSLSQADPFRDPVEDFLFHTRRGHCQFFASAMVLMCRALGVQARLAGGFLANEYGGVAGGYIVRAADAHAWCEVFTDSTDWIIMDPTPPGSLEAAVGRRGGLEDLWGSLRFWWQTRVIGYGESDRQSLFGAFLRKFQVASWRLVRFLKDTAQAAWALVTQRFSWGLLLSALPALAMVLAAATVTGLLAALVRRWRRRPRVPVHPSLPKFYRRLVRLLWRRGRRQRPEQTAREFLSEVATELRLPPAALGELADFVYEIRWGRLHPSSAALARAEHTVRQIARRVRARRQA